MKDGLNYLDYLRAAFSLRVNLKGLGSLPLNQLLLAGLVILGFGNAGFWFLGLACELAYLLILSGSQRFQRLIRGERLASDREKRAEEQSHLLASLDRLSRERYDRLGALCRSVLRAAESMAGPLGVSGLPPDSLGRLQWIFFELLISCQRLRGILERTSRAELEQEIKTIQDRLGREAEDSPVHRSLRGTLEIQQRRLDNIMRAEDGLRFTEAELDRLEKQVKLLSEETAVVTDPETWSLRVDGVMKSVQGTTQWLAEHTELFDSFNDYSPMEATGSSRQREKE